MSFGHSYYAQGHAFAQGEAPPHAGYTSTGMFPPFQGNAMPLPFQMAETGFPSLQHGAAPPKALPHDIRAQRARTPCKHFEYHLGWCPYGMNCHFLHDYARLPSRASSFGGSSDSSSCPSFASSASSSPRDSPIPFPPYYPSPGVAANPYAYSIASTVPMNRIPRHGFVPRAVGGTTYFPIRLDAVRLGFVTPVGVEVFTDH
ncbi:hypothetical protein EI94DRAFT_1782218 [Lactarius quietus]|nr:hypothetical protein EI94DRAFT_1782218 [Lactarius quietus]